MGEINGELPQQWVRCGDRGNTHRIFHAVANAEQQAPWEGCRAASKTEYESAKRIFLLQASFRTYARTGHWWRRYY